VRSEFARIEFMYDRASLLMSLHVIVGLARGRKVRTTSTEVSEVCFKTSQEIWIAKHISFPPAIHI